MLNIFKSTSDTLKELNSLCEEIKNGAKTTVDSIRTNGVILETIKVRKDQDSK